TAFWLLFLTRCFVGVGEGAYGPVAPTMISDLYPLRDRGRVLAWFYLAIPVGGALGYALGEVVKDLWGWRWAFYVVVPPGLLLGLGCFLMREPRRGQAARAEAVPRGEVPAAAGAAGPASLGEAVPPRQPTRRDYLNLFTIPSYVLNTLGMT